MKKILSAGCIALFSILIFIPAAHAYKYIDSNSGSNCQDCHTDWAGYTAWHSSHESEVGLNCVTCHSSGTNDQITVSSCSTSSCHTDETWQGNPDYHSVIGELDCMSCHEDMNNDCPLERSLNSENKIAVLKQFRDQVLARNAAGRAVIDLYYTAAPAITRALDSSPALKQVTASLVDLVMPLIEKYLASK